MENKVAYSLNFIWTCLVAYFFPLCFGMIFLNITGHAKGYSYDLSGEQTISFLVGYIQFLIWRVISMPSLAYVFLKTKEKGNLYLLIPLILYMALSVLWICQNGGWSLYLEDVFNL